MMIHVEEAPMASRSATLKLGGDILVYGTQSSLENYPYGHMMHMSPAPLAHPDWQSVDLPGPAHLHAAVRL